MKNVINETVKLLIISFLISFLISLSSEFYFAIYIFSYLVSLLIVPYWIRNNSVNKIIKISLTLLVGLISSLFIINNDGIGRILYSYLIIFGIVIIGSNVKFLRSEK